MKMRFVFVMVEFLFFEFGKSFMMKGSCFRNETDGLAVSGRRSG
jgi:hypothetical protein